MLRWPFTILSAVSLLLLIAAAVVWGRSYRVFDQWLVAHPRTGGTYVQVSRGTVRVARFWWPGEWRDSYSNSEAPRSLETASLTDGITDPWFDFAGLSYGKGRVGLDPHGFIADPGPDEPSWPTSVSTCPFWLIAAVLAMLPAVWLATWPRHRRRVRRRRGQCERCGYDLRGSAGACPECGAGCIR